MDYLLDSHAFLWFINGDAHLSSNAKSVVEDATTNKYVSIASIWEIAVKLSIGKLTLDFAFDELRQHLILNNFKLLPLSFDDSAILSLPLYHRDPFDRMLVAQSINRNFSLISKDEYFPLYNVPIIW